MTNKKVKRISMILAALMVAGAATGCGAKKDTKVESTNEVATNASKKIMTCKDGNPGVQIGDTYLEVGKVTLQDFLDVGAEFIPGTVEKEPSYLMDPNDGTTAHLTYQQTSLSLEVTNESDEMEKLSKAIVYQISVEEGAEVIAPCGIKIGDSIKDVEDILGKKLESETINRDEILYQYRNKLGGRSMNFTVNRNNPDVISKFAVYMPVIPVETKGVINKTIIQAMLSEYPDRTQTSIHGIFDDSLEVWEAPKSVDGKIVDGPKWEDLLLCKVKNKEKTSNSSNDYSSCDVFLIATYSVDVEISEDTRKFIEMKYGKDCLEEISDSYETHGAIVFGDPVYDQKSKKMLGKTPGSTNISFMDMNHITFKDKDIALETYLTGDTIDTFPQGRTLDDYEITTISLKKYN